MIVWIGTGKKYERELTVLILKKKGGTVFFFGGSRS